MESQFQFSDKEYKLPELLVPAGNISVLKYALEYGADAVYIGGVQMQSI